MTPVGCHGFDPRQAVHLNVALFERGEMIQFCGLVRVCYHFRFFFGDVTHIRLHIRTGRYEVVTSPNIESECECKLKFKT